MTMLIATSINPYNKIEYQIRCFERWMNEGFKVITFNTKKESELLIEAGIRQEYIEKINTDESGVDLFAKEMPRVLPVLRRIKQKNYENYIITNSDIYYAGNKYLERVLASSEKAVSFTRNECLNASAHRYSESNQYRGGLDIFYLNNEALNKILILLENDSKANRMTFGVPGWDFYLAHCLLQINYDVIIDGEIFLHESHKTSYGNVKEFEYYADAMLKTNLYKSKNEGELIQEFLKKIKDKVIENTEKSKFIRNTCYLTPSRKDLPCENQDDTFLINKILDKIRPLGYKIKSRMMLLTYLHAQYTGLNWPATTSFANAEFEYEGKIQKSVGALLIMLILMRHFNQAEWNEKYPKGNLHMTALRQILNNTTGKEKLNFIVNLFASELVEHKILNRKISDYILLSFENKRDVERWGAVVELTMRNK